MHIGLSRCVFNGHIDQIALCVQVNVEIFIDLASFHHILIGKLHLRRVSVFEVFKKPLNKSPNLPDLS